MRRAYPAAAGSAGTVHTLTHVGSPQTVTSCGIVNSMALLADPQAGKTVVNRWSEVSR